MSPRRVPHRHTKSRAAAYDAYMRSRTWFGRRRAWAEEEARRHGGQITCAVCDLPWTIHDDLHHVDYGRLRAEGHEGLRPLHRHCHDDVHMLLQLLGLRRSMPIRLANDVAIARARARFRASRA